MELWPPTGAKSLRDTTQEDGPLDYTFTDRDGHYRFDNVPVGDYLVVEIDPEGMSPDVGNEILVTVIEGQTVEANFRDVPAYRRTYLPLVLK